MVCPFCVHFLRNEIGVIIILVSGCTRKVCKKCQEQIENSLRTRAHDMSAEVQKRNKLPQAAME